ncbi:MAG: hypothetical protein R2690_07605 [Acidimicrobiales bacterium]
MVADDRQLLEDRSAAAVAAVLFVAGVLSIGWGIVSVIGASLHYGQLFLGIGIALATFGFVYRRRRQRQHQG